MGDGRIRSISFDDQYEAATIEIPQDLLLQRGDNPLETIFKSVYRRFQDNYHDRSYLQSTAIVTPYNETVDFVNDYMLSLLPDLQTYTYDGLPAFLAIAPWQPHKTYKGKDRAKVVRCELQEAKNQHL